MAVSDWLPTFDAFSRMSAVEELAPGFDKTTQAERFIVVWKYLGERGMPVTVERQHMDAMERETSHVHAKYKMLEQDYGQDTFLLVLAGGHLKRLLGNGAGHKGAFI